MGWLIGIIAAFLILVLLFRFPLQTIALVAILGFGVWFWIDSTNRAQRERFERSRSLVETEEVELTDLGLQRSYSMWSLTGNAKNNSSNTVTALELLVVLRNCPTPDDCVVVGEDTATAFVNIPPGQMRSVGTTFSFPNLPTLNDWTWFYTLLAVQAR